MSDPARNCLEVKHLTVEFPGRHGTVTALDDVSLSISPGEILGVVGESGAGKSMTGLAIQGLLEQPGRITGGEVLLDGRRIDTLSDREMEKIRGREIGAIFQDPLTSLNPLFSVGGQLVETIRQHMPQMSKSDARARAIGPVSYTHLDVYKRQVLAHENGAHILLRNGEVVMEDGVILFTGHGFTGEVALSLIHI